MNLSLWVSCFQGDLKQYLKLAKAKEEKPKSHHLSTKQKVSTVFTPSPCRPPACLYWDVLHICSATANPLNTYLNDRLNFKNRFTFAKMSKVCQYG